MYKGTMYKVQRGIVLLLCMVCSFSLSAQDFRADRDLLDAYLRNDMPVWRQFIDSAQHTEHLLIYEYGYCAARIETDGGGARPFVKRFRRHVEMLKEQLPSEHYAMYMSAVYVYEMKIHESFHPLRALSLARDAVNKAPNDPLTLTHYGLTLFYAPKPVGNKREALRLFLKAEKIFADSSWENCWLRPAAQMYIAQCYDKQGDKVEAVRRAKELLEQYPDYLYIKNTYLPALLP